MNENTKSQLPGTGRILWVGLLVGLMLNITGWLGNNLLLGLMWEQVGATLQASPWRSSVWRDVFSFAPDFLYGLAIAWLCVVIRLKYKNCFAASIRAGLLVAMVGGITTYFAIANSGFIPWQLAFASFGLVLGTKLPLAMLAGYLLEPTTAQPPD